jgi:hypothetical protein
MEELTKCRDHVNQLLGQENDQLEEIHKWVDQCKQLLAENSLLKEEQSNSN